MSQAALNLIAISVFAMTMLSLLGPMLHLSPLVPAIATASVLGLATLDTFSLRGQGGAVLVDWFASTSPEYRARIVRHEAGHFLVAHLLQIPVVSYALSPWQALKQGQMGQGGVRFDTQELDAELQQGRLSVQLLDRYSAVWMAGTVAETLVYGNAEGGADDRQQLNAVLAQLRRPASEYAQKQRWSALRAKTLLEEHWSAYEALVAAMEQQAPVEECYRAIAQQLNPVPSH